MIRLVIKPLLFLCFVAGLANGLVHARTEPPLLIDGGPSAPAS
ncbi:hypothetical protein ABDK56_09040 [Sphingomonas sp. ASV193]